MLLLLPLNSTPQLRSYFFSSFFIEILNVHLTDVLEVALRRRRKLRLPNTLMMKTKREFFSFLFFCVSDLT